MAAPEHFIGGIDPRDATSIDNEPDFPIINPYEDFRTLLNGAIMQYEKDNRKAVRKKFVTRFHALSHSSEKDPQVLCDNIKSETQRILQEEDADEYKFGEALREAGKKWSRDLIAQWKTPLDAELADLRERVSKGAHIPFELQNQLEESEAKCRRLENQIEASKDHLKAYPPEKVQALEDEIQKLETEWHNRSRDYNQEIKKLEIELMEQIDNNTVHENSVKRWEDDNKELTKDIARMQEYVTQLENHSRMSKAQSEKFQEENAQLKIEREQLAVNKMESDNQLEEAQLMIVNLLEQLRERRTENDRIEEEKHRNSNLEPERPLGNLHDEITSSTGDSSTHSSVFGSEGAETTRTTGETPATDWTGTTMVGSAQGSPSKLSKSTGMYPFVEYIHPVLQQVAFYHSNGAFVRYEEIEDDMLVEGAVLSSLGAMLAQLDHYGSRNKEKLGLNIHVIQPLKFWVEDRLNSTGASRLVKKAINDNIARILKGYENEDKEILAKQDSLEKERQTIQEQANQAQSSLQDAQDALKEREAELKAELQNQREIAKEEFQRQEDAARRELHETQDELQELQEELKECKLKVEKYQAEYEFEPAMTKQVLAEADETNKALQEKKVDLEKRIVALETQIEEDEKAFQTKTSDLEDKLQELERARNETQQELEVCRPGLLESERLLREHETEMTRLDSEIALLTEQKAEIEQQRTDLAETNLKLQTKLADGQDILEGQQTEIERLKRDNDQLEADRNILAATVDKESKTKDQNTNDLDGINSQRQQIQEYAAGLEKSKKEIEKLHREIASLKQEIERLNQETDKAKQVEDLEKKLAEADRRLEAAEMTKNGLKRGMEQNMDIYKRMIQGAEEKNDNLLENLRKTKEERDEYRTSLDARTEQLAKLQGDYDALEKEPGRSPKCSSTTCKQQIQKVGTLATKALTEMHKMQAELDRLVASERATLKDDWEEDEEEVARSEAQQCETAGLELARDKYHKEADGNAKRLDRLEAEEASTKAKEDLEEVLDVGKRLLKFYRIIQAILGDYRAEKLKYCQTILLHNPLFMEDMDIYITADIRRLEARHAELSQELRTLEAMGRAGADEDILKQLNDDIEKSRALLRRLDREIEKYRCILDEINLHSVLADELLVASEQYNLDPDTRRVQALMDDRPEDIDSGNGQPSSPSPFAASPPRVTTTVPPVSNIPRFAHPRWLFLLLCAIGLFLYGFVAQQEQKEKWSAANKFSRAMWVNDASGGMTFTWVHLAIITVLNMKAFYRSE